MTSCIEQDMKAGINQQDVAQDWIQRGFSCELWVAPPAQLWSQQIHPQDELIMPITGELEVSFREHLYRLKAGQELQIPAQMSHSLRNATQTTICWLYGYKQASACAAKEFEP